MSQLVKDDRRGRKDCAAADGNRRSAFRIRLGGTMRVSWLPALLVGLASTLGATALAQDGDDTGFSVILLDLSGRMQRVTVPLHGSITVDTSSAVIRADVVAPEIADVTVISPKRLLLTGQSYGNTTVMLLREDKQQYVLEVSVELDLTRLNETIAQIDPQADAHANSVLGNIVLIGTASSAERAKRIVEIANLFLPRQSSGLQPPVVQNHLDLAGVQQVLLHCVIAEMNRTAARELGVNGFFAGENVRDGFLINQIGGINPANIGAAGGALVTDNIPFVVAEGGIPVSPNATLSLGFPRVQLQTFIKALAENSLLRVLAEPKLVAISGETASFLAGGEIPVPEPQGFQTVTISYREFGVRLNFTPIVRGHGRIRLRVNPEVSELDPSSGILLDGFVIPGFRSRSTETTVELGDGETLVIAGLLSEQVRGFASSVPGIGEIPVLGALFRSIEFQRSMTELVILVTPEIVAPLDAHQIVQLPGEDSMVPSDYELYLLGLLEGSNTNGDGGAHVARVARHLDSEPQQLSVHGPWGHARSNGAR